MRRAEQVAAAFCVVLGVGIVCEARRMEYMTSLRRNGGGFWRMVCHGFRPTGFRRGDF